MSIIYAENNSSEDDIFLHICDCNDDFVPPLSTRVDIKEFAKKISLNTVRFEAWNHRILVGLVSAYFNAERGFINHVSVLRSHRKQGISSKLIAMCLEYGKSHGFKKVHLEVAPSNKVALETYEKQGFKLLPDSKNIMEAIVGSDRNFDEEIKDASDHKYAYNFDFDVMHPFMVRSFEPFFKKGSLLELGSFKGDFTQRLTPFFDDISCVEAAGGAIQIAKNRLDKSVKFYHSMFEDAVLPKKYDNIILTHVLEHLDDPVAVLRRVNDEWLADGGRFFLVCPNANAPSRQIAVKMGLISHNTAITPSEHDHGHRITYTLDTLERDAQAAGLKVAHRSGIFFKALANFQWDRLLETDIISPDYLEGCYQLGQQYPDLCSSIFLMCEKGKE